MASPLYRYKWEKARKVFLSSNPLCVMCQQQGLIVRANVVDHIIPHCGDMNLFWDRKNWQALCVDHHNVDKQRIEHGGAMRQEPYDDGWPRSDCSELKSRGLV